MAGKRKPLTAPVFTVPVDEQGRWHFNPVQKRGFSMWLLSLAGKTIDVIAVEHENNRSAQQNRWLWGVAYELIVADWGYERHERPAAKEHLHYKLIRLCFGTHFDERLGEEVPNVRSSQLSTKEFGEYMEWLVRYAAQELNGTIIPLPNELAA